MIMAKLKNSKKFEKLEERMKDLKVLLSIKEEQRRILTCDLSKEIHKINLKIEDTSKKLMQQFYDEGGDF